MSAVTGRGGPDVEALKSALASAVRLLTAEGLMDFNGHMSARIPGSDQLFINAREVSRVSVRGEDIVTVASSGRQVAGEGTPPSETPIHTRIYAARPDVHCVAHLHPQFATVFSIATRPLVPVFITGSPFPREGVPVYDDPDLIRSSAQGDAVARTLGTARAVLLRGHGAVVVGEDIERCFVASIWLEENAKKQLWAAALGTPRSFTEEETERIRATLLDPTIIRKTWDFYFTKGKRTGIL